MGSTGTDTDRTAQWDRLAADYGHLMGKAGTDERAAERNSDAGERLPGGENAAPGEVWDGSGVAGAGGDGASVHAERVRVESGAVRPAHAGGSDRDTGAAGDGWTTESFGDGAYLIRPPGDNWQQVRQQLRAVPGTPRPPVWTFRRVLFLILCALAGLAVPAVMWLRSALTVHSSTRGSVIVVVILTVVVIVVAAGRGR
jgi:hypothetical protein